MALRGTDPESFITECTLVYEDQALILQGRQGSEYPEATLFSIRTERTFLSLSLAPSPSPLLCLSLSVPLSLSLSLPLSLALSRGRIRCEHVGIINPSMPGRLT